MGFDYERFFTEDYDYFVQAQLTHGRTAEEVNLIARLFPQHSNGAVLDVGCGTGRIAIELARRGASVTGFDTNAAYVDVARTRAADEAVDARFEVGDMREMTGRTPKMFDLVLLWSNTFGYFDDDTNAAQLHAAYAALRPGGILLLDQHNRDWVLRNWQRVLVVHQGDDHFMDENTFDVLTGRTNNRRTYVRGGRVTGSARFNSRLFCPPELAQWLLQAGFRDVVFRGEDGEPLTIDHRRQVVSAMRY